MLETHLLGFQHIRGKRVSLVRRAPEHASFLKTCFDDSAFMDLYRLTQKRKESVEHIAQRLETEIKKLPQDLRKFEWVIQRHYDSADKNEAHKSKDHKSKDQNDKLIGLAAVADYQPSHSRAEFLIGILRAEDQKAGVGLEASLLVLDFAFNFLKLHKFISFVYGHNSASQSNTIQLGFTQEALMREHIFYKPMGYIDMYQNGMLEADFRSNSRLARLSKRMLGRDITQKAPEPQKFTEQALKHAEQAFRAALKKTVKH